MEKEEHEKIEDKMERECGKQLTVSYGEKKELEVKMFEES